MYARWPRLSRGRLLELFRFVVYRLTFDNGFGAPALIPSENVLNVPKRGSPCTRIGIFQIRPAVARRLLNFVTGLHRASQISATLIGSFADANVSQRAEANFLLLGRERGDAVWAAMVNTFM